MIQNNKVIPSLRFLRQNHNRNHHCSWECFTFFHLLPFKMYQKMLNDLLKPFKCSPLYPPNIMIYSISYFILYMIKFATILKLTCNNIVLNLSYFCNKFMRF